MSLFIILYLVNFIRTLVIIVAIYFIIKLFTRYVLPLILENKIRQMHRNMEGRSSSHYRTGKQEGEVTIEHDRQKNNNTRQQDEGEYVDFEEVD
ncbi:MAG: DUF4834 family protein [Bacteroidota bacterium]